VRFPVALIACATWIVACRPSTTRPPLTPYPEAAGTEVRLTVPEATRRLAEALKADSIVPRQVRLRDGYIETGWFMAANGRPAGGRRPLGTGVVRIRAWADPARPGSSQLTVETLYRPLADPSLPERELEREVPRDHPVAVKGEGARRRLVDRYGGSPGPQAEPAPTRTREPDQPNEPDQADDIE
jgi:hypothetical protein